MKLQTDILAQSVGRQVVNHKGNYMGTIVELTYDKTGEKVQYIILRSDRFFGRKERYFALPAYSKLLKITRGGKVVLNVGDKDFHSAKRIPTRKCPRPIFEFNPSIYELYDYSIPTEKENAPGARSEIQV